MVFPNRRCSVAVLNHRWAWVVINLSNSNSDHNNQDSSELLYSLRLKPNHHQQRAPQRSRVKIHSLIWLDCSDPCRLVDVVKVYFIGVCRYVVCMTLVHGIVHSFFSILLT